MTEAQAVEYFSQPHWKLRSRVGGSLPAADDIGGIMSRWMDAVNRQDIDAQLSFCTEDVVVEDPAMLGRAVRGHKDFLTFAEITYAAFPDMRFEETGAPLISLDGNTLALPWRGTGTLTGDILGWPPENPAPRVTATGRRFDIQGVDRYEFRDGLICQWRIGYDGSDMSAQLGLLPPADTRA